MPSEKTSPRSKSDRRVTKPIMEKKRRARINRSLSELKSFLITHSSISDEQTIKDKKKSKFEKADILEMTVRYLQEQMGKPEPQLSTLVQSPQDLSGHERLASPAQQEEKRTMFEDGFSECTKDVVQFLGTYSSAGVGADARSRLLSHLRQRWLVLFGDRETPSPRPISPTGSHFTAVDLSASRDRDYDSDWASRLSPISDDSDCSGPPSPVYCAVSSTTDAIKCNVLPSSSFRKCEDQKMSPKQDIDGFVHDSHDPVWRPW